jgi:hypothetical protein
MQFFNYFLFQIVAKFKDLSTFKIQALQMLFYAAILLNLLLRQHPKELCVVPELYSHKLFLLRRRKLFYSCLNILDINIDIFCDF